MDAPNLTPPGTTSERFARAPYGNPSEARGGSPSGESFDAPGERGAFVQITHHTSGTKVHFRQDRVTVSPPAGVSHGL